MYCVIGLGVDPSRYAGANDVLFAASSVVRNGVSGMIAPGRRIVHAPLRLPRIETNRLSFHDKL
jgi:hypothetical protein